MTAQNRKDYFVVVKSNYSLEPIKQIVNPDQTLTLDLIDSSLEAFLNSLPIYSLSQGFSNGLFSLFKTNL